MRCNVGQGQVRRALRNKFTVWIIFNGNPFATAKNTVFHLCQETKAVTCLLTCKHPVGVPLGSRSRRSPTLSAFITTG